MATDRRAYYREYNKRKGDRHKKGYYTEYNKKHPERLARIGIIIGSTDSLERHLTRKECEWHDDDWFEGINDD